MSNGVAVQIDECVNDVYNIVVGLGATVEKDFLRDKMSTIMWSGSFNLKNLSLVVYGAIEWNGGAIDLYHALIRLSTHLNDFYEEYVSLDSYDNLMLMKWRIHNEKNVKCI